MTAVDTIGQTRSLSDVGSMSGLPESGRGLGDPLLTWFEHHTCHSSLPGGYSVLPAKVGILTLGYDRVDLGSEATGTSISEAMARCETDYAQRQR
jgi:hypothetical protein